MAGRTPPEILATVLEAIVAGHETAAATAMEELSGPAWTPRRRRPAPLWMHVAVYRRDHFHCRYCQRRTIFYPLFELLSLGFFPKAMPFHPNWRAGEVHPVVITWGCSLDHVMPVAAGGRPVDPRNLVTACADCQYTKGNSTRGWDLMPVPEDTWDGLSGYYKGLWETAQYTHRKGVQGLGRRRSHDDWLAALRRTDVIDDDAFPGGFADAL